MSTKQHTNTTNLYNDAGYKAYNAFQPALQRQLLDMSQNPFGTPGFQAQLGFTTAANNALAQRNTTTMMHNLKTGGGILSNAGGLTNALAQRGALNASSMASSGIQSAVASALNNRNFALGAMEAYQPLQTGTATQQYSTGAGTWLPQVAGLAMNALMPGIGSMMGGGSFAAGYSGGGGGIPNVMNGARPFLGGGGAPPPMNLSGMAAPATYNPFLTSSYAY